MIENKDLFKDDLFDDEIKKAVTLAKALETLDDSFKGILAASSKLETKDAFKNYDKLKELEANIQTFETAIKGLKEVEAQRNALVKEATLSSQKYQKEIEDLTASTSELEAELSKLGREQTKDIARMKEIDNRLSANKRRTDQLANSIRVLSAVKDKSVKATEANIRAYRILEQETKDQIALNQKLAASQAKTAAQGGVASNVGGDAGKVSRLADAYNKLSGAVRTAIKNIRNFKGDVSEAGQKADKTETRIGRLARSMKNVSGGFVFGAVAGFASNAVGTAVDLFAGARENALKLEVVLKGIATLLLKLFEQLVKGISKVAENIAGVLGLNPFVVYVNGVKQSEEATKAFREELEKLDALYEKSMLKTEDLLGYDPEQLKFFSKLFKAGAAEKLNIDDYIAEIEKLRADSISKGIGLEYETENISRFLEILQKNRDELSGRIWSAPIPSEMFLEQAQLIDDYLKKTEESGAKFERSMTAGMGKIFGPEVASDITATIDLLLKETPNAMLKYQVAFDSAQLSVQKLANEYDNLMQQAGDGTLSMQKQAEALALATAKSAELEKAERSLAVAQINLAKSQIALRVGASDISGITAAYITETAKAGKISQAEADGYIEALNAVENATNAVTARALERATTYRDILSEQFENTLDAYLDLTDSTVSANEVLFNDETRLLADRVQAYTTASNTIQKSQDDAIKAIIAYQKAIGDTGAFDPSKTTIATEAVLKGLIDGLKAGTLTITDIDKQLQSFGFNSEQVTNIQAFLRDFVDFKEVLDTMDIARLQMEFGFKDADVKAAQAYLDKLRAINAIMAGGAISQALGGPGLSAEERQTQLDAFASEQEKFDDADLQRQIDVVKAKIKFETAAGKEIIDLQKELQELELQQQQNFYDRQKAQQEKALEEQKQNEEKAVAERAELAKSSFALLNALNDKYADDRLRSIDAEIQNTAKREEYLLALAEKGSEKLTENLAFEQKKQAELELQREQIEKNRQRRALALAALEVFQTNLVAAQASGSANPSLTALGKTAIDISLLQALVGSLPSFYEGTEDTGNGSGLDDKGGMLAVLHPHERVLPEKLNRKVIGLSNAELVERATAFERAPREARFEAIEGKLEELIDVTKKKEVYLGGDYQEMRKTFVETVKREGSILRKHSRTDSIF